MTKVTRRGFIKQTSMSVATVGILAAAPALAAEPGAAEETATQLSTNAAEVSAPLIAHISDFASGEISLLFGTQEVIYRDPELIMRLLRAIP
jgi:ABC-type cobalt transport system substrate-binding protein